MRSSTRDSPPKFYSRRKRCVIFSTFVLAQKHPFTIPRSPVEITLGNSGFIDLLLHGRSRSGQKITRHPVFPHSNEIFSGLRPSQVSGRFKQFRNRDFLIIKVFFFFNERQGRRTSCRTYRDNNIFIEDLYSLDAKVMFILFPRMME